MRTLVDRLTEAMKAKGLNKADLSRLSKVPKTTIQSIFDTPARSPRGTTIQKLAAALGVQAGDLIAEPVASTARPGAAVKPPGSLDERQERLLLTGVRAGLVAGGIDPDSPEGMRKTLSAFDKAKADLAAKRDDPGGLGGLGSAGLKPSQK
jgi:transcriptional regulator with XRE-family HTH domain